MVTQRPPAASQTSKVPVQPHRSMDGDGSRGNEANEGYWQETNSRGYQPSSASSHTIPRKAAPDGTSKTASSPMDDDDDNEWDEARSQTTRTGTDTGAAVGAGTGTYSFSPSPHSLTPGAGSNGTNPFLRKPVTSQTPNTSPSPVSIQPPNESLSKLSLNESSNSHNPWQTGTETEATQVGGQLHSAPPTDFGSCPWAQDPQQAPQSPALLSLHSEGSGWEDDTHSAGKGKGVAPSGMAPMSDELLQEQHVWDDGNASRPPHTTTEEARAAHLCSVPGAPPLDDWNLVDAEPCSDSRQQLHPSAQAGDDAEGSSSKPSLPPRSPGEQVRWVSSRLNRDRSSETYHVKKVQWYDASSTTNPRVSPILIQNENGPCPLVALVNALTLTTPADVSETALVQVLRCREQISLNLLLDAVFDELMSPRRTNSEDSLPDVSDLYAFLQSLHTGMNVNPRFIPTPKMVDAFEHTSLTNLEPNERGHFVPGTFENTLEMSLYAAFSIPLIHGWLPPKDDPARAAMERHAGSYEDVQNLLFREEELENKLSSDAGLSEAEQQLYEEIVAIRMFLESSATQLTPWGIEVIGKAMRPGTFAILFRNDHFSTLYSHPERLQLYTLVTDAGYGRHDEVVWESLVDVNGEMNEFLSGDFRVTRGTAAASNSSRGRHSDEDGQRSTWAAPGGGKMRGHDGTKTSVEQEDEDLALALQLQEEEEQRHREEQERRQRETILSERYIEQQARRPLVPADPSGRSGFIPARRSSNSVNAPPGMTTAARLQQQDVTPRHSAQTLLQLQQQQQARQQHQQMVRPLVPPRRGVNRPVNHDDEPPPPSYEQAAQVPAYIPPLGHPNHPGSTPTTRREARASNTSGMVNADGRGQRPTVVSTGTRRPASRERECLVM